MGAIDHRLDNPFFAQLLKETKPELELR